MDFLAVAYDFTGFAPRAPPAALLAELYAPGPDQPESKDALFDFAYHSRDLPAATKQALKSWPLLTSAPISATNTSPASTG